MKRWEQALIMAFVSFVISAIVLIIADIDWGYGMINLFVEQSPDTNTLGGVLETTIGTFAMILGIGLLILTYLMYLQEKSTMPNPLPVYKEGA